ncbi:MAG: acyl-CoA dehydrogenase family protein [Pseudomonadales bacterium]|jgi:alkylation response protein AidB-like acyl-CoA dehydrogenase|nr:acyl-CoA dehydrogenase family protein [Pseudomonadales bacterium]MCP5319502.1 acyl-CoA dehydrogenase family protein [Pseudomonadales bacterium]MCP5338442.1 acyl-CoA dehydrogenase family protein [Pseudomonadales bacterium]
MDFEFSEDEKQFIRDVREFLRENHDPDVMDLHRENLAQLSDTPARRAFMQKLARRGWLGITWPKEYGGQDGKGFYEYLLNELLSGVGAPQLGKGTGVVGKTLIRVASDKLKREFLPKILAAEVEFALGYTEPSAGSDAAAMRLKAERSGEGWLLNGQKTFTTSAHFADWYWVGARTDPDAPKHHGISLFMLPMNHPGLTIQAMYTIGGERTNAVFFDNVFVHDDYRVGNLNKGFQYIAEALDIERFGMFTFSPVRGRTEALCDYVRSEQRDGKPLKDDPVIRQRVAQLATECEAARLLGVRFVDAALSATRTPTAEASAYKLYATEFSRRLADATMDIVGPGGQLTRENADAPMEGRPPGSYVLTLLETIGGGTSEIQRNIIATRKLGLPKNF